MTTFTYASLKAFFVSSLGDLYDTREAVAIFHLYLSAKLRISKVQFYLDAGKMVPSDLLQEVMEDIHRLNSGEPVQYVCGRCDFYGIELRVNASVLIPRPETEELVQLIIEENRTTAGLRVLDLGTGSGAIAIALAKHLPDATVVAIDLSEAALAAAQENAGVNNVTVLFEKVDILKEWPEHFSNFDIMVSNPPYIPESEKRTLHRNVTDFEPGTALFVPDADPLLFYRRIGEIGRVALRKKGQLYFETHDLFHDETEALLFSLGYQTVRKIKDMNGKPRFLTCR